MAAVTIDILGKDGTKSAFASVSGSVKDLKNDVAGLRFDDVSGRWRTAAGHFASNGQLAAAGIRKAGDAATQAGRQADAGAGGFNNLGGAFSGIGAKAVAFGNILSGAITGGIGLLASGFQSAITAGASFGETLNRIQAVGGATSDQLAVINAKALELGAKLPISAQQAADGMLALVSGGMSVENALTAVEGVSSFAAAQMLQVGDAAEIVSASLTSFGLGADKASFAADVMSQVANASAASVQDWGEAIKYVGPVAGALKQPIEDMAVAVGLMANQSIKGSSAGTALRTMLTSLAAPSANMQAELTKMGVATSNAAGQMLPFIDIAEQFRDKMGGMTDIQKANLAEMVAGKEGMSGFLAIVGAAPADFDKMRDSMKNAEGATAEFAKATNKGFAFEWGQLQGSIETVLIQGFQAVEPVLSAVTSSATGLVNAIGSGMTQVGPMIQAVIPYVTAIGDAISATMAGGNPFGQLADTLSEFGVISEGTSATLYSMGTAFDYVRYAVLSLAQSDLAGFVANIAAAFGMGENEANALGSAVSSVASQIGSVLSQVGAIITGIFGSAFATAGQIAQSVLGGLPALFMALAGPAQSIASSVGSFLVSAFQSVGSVAQSVFAGLPGLAQTVMGVFTAFASFVGSTLAGAFQIVGPIASSVFSGIATVAQLALPGIFALANAVGSMLMAAFAALQAVAVSVFAAIQPYIPAVQAAIGQLATAVGSVLGSAFQAAASFVTGTVVPALTNLGTWLAANLPAAIDTLANFWISVLLPAISAVAGWITGTLFPALGELFNWLQAQIPGALQVLSNFWTGTLLPAIATVAGWVTGTLFPLFGVMVTWLQTTITAALQVLSDFWQTHGDTILSIAQTTWDTIQSAIDSVLAAIATVWKAWTQTQEGDWRGFGETLRSVWDATWEAVKSAIIAAVPVIISTVTGLVTSAQEAFTSVDWHEVGVNIISGIENGISSMANSLAEKAAAVAKAAYDAITGFFDMGSPSKLMKEAGGYVVEGLGIGIMGGLPSLISQTVGGMKTLVLQINKALEGIGDIENGRFERMRDALGALADGFGSLSSIGDSLKGGGLDAVLAASETIKKIAANTKTLLAGTPATPTTKGIPGVSDMLNGIGAISNEKFQQWGDALKDLASGLSSISSIGALFSGEIKMPDMSKISETIKTLAKDAVSLLADLNTVVPVLADGLVDRLKALGDGASAAKGVADGALGLVQSLVAAMAYDWVSVNFGDAGAMLKNLIAIAVFLTQRAGEAIAGVKLLDTSGLAPLKAALDSIIPLALMVPEGITALVAALTYDWESVNFSDVGNMLKNLAKIAVFLVLRATEGAAGIKDLDLTGLAPLKAALDSILPLATLIPEGLKALQAALTFDWNSINFSEVGRMMSDLAKIAVFLATRAAEGAAGLTELPPQLTILRDAIGLVGNILTSALDTIKTLSEAEVPTAPFATYVERLGRIIPLAVGLAEVVLVMASTFTGSIKPAATTLGAALSLSLGILKDGLSIIKETLGAAVNEWANVPFSAFVARLGRTIPLAASIADVVLVMASTFTGVVTDAATALGSALELSLGVLKNSLELIKLFMTTLASGPLNMAGAEYHPEFADALTTYAISIAAAFLLAANAFTGVVTEAATRLGNGLDLALGVSKNALEIFALFTKTLASGPLNMAGAEFHPEFIDAITRYAMDVTLAFLLIANTFTGVVAEAATRLGAGLDLALSVSKNALEILALFTKTLANGPLNMSGAEFHPEFIDAITQYAIDVTAAFLLIANTFTGTVAVAAGTLKDGIDLALGVSKSALEILALFTKTLASGPLNMAGAEFHPEFVDALARYAMDVALAFLLTANTFTGVVAPASVALKDGIDLALGVSKNALEILALFMKTLAKGPLNMAGAEFHPEFVDALARYAMDVAGAFLVVANTFTGVVSDAAKEFEAAIDLALGVSKSALEIFTLFATTLAKGPLSMAGAQYHPEFVDALTTYAIEIASAFLLVANTFPGIVSDAATELGKALGEALGIVKDVLEFNGLKSLLLNFKGIDMGLLGPKIDLIFLAALAIANKFALAAQNSGLSEEFAKAGQVVAGVFGDAVGVLNDAIDLGAKLLDPETQIPSVGQIQTKLKAALDFMSAVLTQFSTAAVAVAPNVNFDAIKQAADSAKSTFDVIMSAVDTISTLREKHIGMDDFDEIRTLMANLFSIFTGFEPDTSAVDAVAASISTMLGGLASMVSSQATAAGVSIGTSIVSGIISAISGGAGAIAGAIGTAVGSGTAAPPPGGAGNGGTTTITTTDNSKTFSINVTNMNGDAAKATGTSLYSLAAYN